MPEDPGLARRPSTTESHREIALGNRRHTVGALGTRFPGLIGHMTMSPCLPLLHTCPSHPVTLEGVMEIIEFFLDAMFERANEGSAPDGLVVEAYWYHNAYPPVRQKDGAEATMHDLTLGCPLYDLIKLVGKTTHIELARSCY